MTLDEHIKKAEQDAIQAESDSDWGFGNFFIDRTDAIAYAKECRQLAEWLKDYKRLLEQEPCEDTNANQHNSNALNDVGQHTNALDAISRQAVLDLIADYDLSMGQVVRGIHALPSVKPQEPKWNRLYSWLNDMRYGIAPDETVTDIDERNVRTAQVDMLDEIMEWMIEPHERSDKE